MDFMDCQPLAKHCFQQNDLSFTCAATSVSCGAGRACEKASKQQTWDNFKYCVFNNVGNHQFKDPTQEILYVKKLQSKLYVATRHPACDSPYTQSSFCLKEKLRAISSLVYAEEHHLVNPALLSLWQPTQDCWWSRGLVQPVKQPPNSFQTDLTASKLRSTFWPVSHLLDVGGRNKTIWPVEGRFIILRGVMVTNTGA